MKVVPRIESLCWNRNAESKQTDGIGIGRQRRRAMGVNVHSNNGGTETEARKNGHRDNEGIRGEFTQSHAPELESTLGPRRILIKSKLQKCNVHF